EFDVDAAFDQPWVLSGLRSRSPKGLVEQVPRVQNRLNLAWKHPAGRQVLGDGKAKSRIVVFHHLLVWIDMSRRERRGPSINSCDLGLSRIHVGSEARRYALKTPPDQLILHFVKTACLTVDTNSIDRGIADSRLEVPELAI